MYCVLCIRRNDNIALTLALPILQTVEVLILKDLTPSRILRYSYILRALCYYTEATRKIRKGAKDGILAEGQPFDNRAWHVTVGVAL